MGQADQNTLQNVQETRIALAFSGGVALAVYESGVAMEFFRLVNGEGVYKDLCQHTGPVVVDVMTGTSAGGLNGAFLANALVNKGDVDRLLSIWREEADIEKLLHRSFMSSPESLLKGDQLYEKIFEALTEKRSAAKPALQPALDLFITATNLDGDRVVIETPDGASIPTRTHRQVFRFRYREKTAGDDREPVNDFRTQDDIKRLALAARTTASFPLAFEPVLIPKGLMAERADHLEADAYHIDGGVLDNRPIALALKAIAERPAAVKVNRLLFYIEPDPEQIGARGWQGEARKYSAPEVVLKAMVTLPGYQSLTGALQDLVLHNKKVGERKRTLTYYEEAAALSKCIKNGQRMTIAQDKQPADHESHRFISPTERSSAFFRAVEDGYLDLRLEQDVSEEIYQAFRELASTLKEDLTEEAMNANLKAQDTHDMKEMAQARPLQNLLYHIECDLLEPLDLKYHRRFFRYLVQVVRKLYPERARGTGDGTGTERELYVGVTAALNGLKDYFYDQEDQVRQMERLETGVQQAELVRLETLLQTVLELVREGKQPKQEGQQPVSAKSATADKDPSDRDPYEKAEKARPWPRGDLVALLLELQTRVRGSDLWRRRCQFLQGLRNNAWLKLRNDFLDLLQKLPLPGLPPSRKEEFKRLLEGYWELRDALDSFFLRDMMIYPAMQDEEIATELQEINFARISPADASALYPGLTANQKLAGKTLAHFGGFLSKDWRGNDLTWGRLDAAEIILSKLLPGSEWKPRRDQLIVDAHKQILDDMAKRGMYIYQPSDKTGFDNLIGKQTLANIPASDKIRWSLLGGLTSLKILRKSLADSQAAWLLKKVVSILDTGINILTWPAAIIALLTRRLSKKVFTVALGAIVLVTVAICLWEVAGRDWWMLLMKAIQW